MRKRQKYNLSHYRPTTCKPGFLYPIGCVEVLPNDTFEHETSVLLRCSPLLAPVMHRATVRVHHFYVPNRILDKYNGDPDANELGWEAFMTQEQDGTAEVPSHIFGESRNSSELRILYENLGAPLPDFSSTNSVRLNALSCFAYFEIWNQYYRDNDLQQEITSTDIATGNYGIMPVSWRKDMFTAARPDPQYGSDVTIALGTSAPVTVDTIDTNGSGSFGIRYQGADPGLTSTTGNAFDGTVDLTGVADLSSAAGINIVTLREALALQKYSERLSQFGHRYPDVLLSGYDVVSKDARIQRPQYLGGGKQMISFSEVLQTSNGTSGPDDVVGSMYGHGISPGRTRKYRHWFEEHGYVISLLSVVPEAVYADSIPRHFFKGFNGGLNNDRLIDDYWQPELERIGQQGILNKELIVIDDPDNAGVFGYGNRYDEYRSVPSQVMGEFRPGRTLDFYTWARSFEGTLPSLNEDFIVCDPSDRIFADQTGTDTLWVLVNHRLRARRLVTRKTIGGIF